MAETGRFRIATYIAQETSWNAVDRPVRYAVSRGLSVFPTSRSLLDWCRGQESRWLYIVFGFAAVAELPNYVAR